MFKWIESEIRKYKMMKIAKTAFKVTAVIGTGIIVKGLLNAVAPKDAGALKKTAIIIGGYVISDAIIERVTNEADATWDRTVNSIKEVKQVIRE